MDQFIFRVNDSDLHQTVNNNILISNLALASVPGNE
jgi:hypothetical protein